MFSKNAKRVFDLSDISNRLRAFVLDTQLPDAHEIAVILGCSVISDEVAEREEEESDKRLERIAHMIPLIYAHAHTISEGTIALQRQTLEDADKVPDEIWEATRQMVEKVSLATTLATVSQIVDMGFVKLPKKRKK